MSNAGASMRRLSPALESLLIAVVAVLTYATLWGLGVWSGADTHIPDGFPLWAATATISFVIWLVVFLSGLRRVHGEPERLRRGRPWWLRSILIYAALAVAASGLLIWVTTSMRQSPEEWWVPTAFRVIIAVLTAFGWAAGAPWVMLVWITHEELRAVGAAADRSRAPEPADEFDPRQVDGESLNRFAHRMQDVWRGIEGPSLALGLILSTLVLNTGTLRIVELDANRPPETFPPSYVLAYGAFFALVVVAIVAPLAIEWRRIGLMVISKSLPEPLSGIPSEAQVTAADRIAARLGLDAPLLRRPITALGLLAPFATAIVASLVPTS
ncbi:hypothetical protein [Agromyces sp. Marseille-Q5079]|uniref:hypothetical protein n=1 Tax=Agromyces sp. Marseille-Q5079 TaxID=3439059 RepID=UPI003D9C9C6A